jgi:ABC-type dipeptide/oligopeptide/nickel transport system permease component
MTARDYIMIETLIVYIAFAVILANTISDIILQIVDPRIRLGVTSQPGSSRSLAGSAKA